MKKAQLYTPQVVTQEFFQTQDETPEGLLNFLLQESDNLQYCSEENHLYIQQPVSADLRQENVDLLPPQIEGASSFTDLMPLSVVAPDNNIEQYFDYLSAPSCSYVTAPSCSYVAYNSYTQQEQSHNWMCPQTFEDISEDESDETEDYSDEDNCFQETYNKQNENAAHLVPYEESLVSIMEQQHCVPVFTNNYLCESTNKDFPSIDKPLFVFYDKQRRQNVVFTQNSLKIILAKNHAFSGLLASLVQNKDIPNSAFNFQMPLLRQNYVDNFIFVNDEEFKRQLQLAKKDYCALKFSNPQLEIFTLFHEGLLLQIEPFSAPIGAFHLIKQNNVIEPSIKIASFLTTIINKTILQQTLQELKEASNGLISAVAFFLEPYKYVPKTAEQFSCAEIESDNEFLFQTTKQEILHKSFLLTSDLNGEMIIVEPKLVESRLQMLVSLLNKEENQKSKILVVIGLMFFKGEERFVGSLDAVGLQPIKSPFLTRNQQLPTTILVTESYGDLVTKVNMFASKNSRVLFFSNTQGLAIEVINTKLCVKTKSKSTNTKCLGMDVSIENFRTLFHKNSADPEIAAKSFKQNSVQEQDVDIKFIMENHLFCGEKPLFIGAKETCLKFQLERLRQNLLFVSTNKQNLHTEFVFLKGFPERLEAFDVLLGVSYEEENMSQASVNKMQNILNEAKKFFQNNDFITGLKEEFGENLEQEFIVRNITLDKVNKPKPHSPFIFGTQKFLLREEVYTLKNIFRGDNEKASVRTFTLSLCSLNVICKHEARREKLYEYQILPLEVKTRGPKINCLKPLAKRKRLNQILKENFEPQQTYLEKKFAPYDKCGCFSHQEESLFTKDYFFQDVTTVEDAQGKMVTKFLIPSQIVLVTFFHKEKQQVVGLTKDGLTFLKNAKDKFTEQLIPFRVRDTDVKAFNYLEPFLKQEYVDDCLFVNKAEMELQMQLATKDLCVFENPECHVLQTFFMFHEGLALEIQPFSCVLGAFYLQRNDSSKNFSYEACIKQRAKQITSLLNQTLKENKKTIKGVLHQIASASDDEIQHVLICCQNYALRFSKPTTKEESRVCKFTKFLYSNKDQCLKRFSLTDLSSKTIQITTSDLEKTLNQFIKSVLKSSLLFLFKIVFLNNLEQLNEIVESRGFRCILQTQETQYNSQICQLPKQVYECFSVAPYITDNDLAHTLTNIYDGSFVVISKPNLGFMATVLYTNEEAYLYFHNTTFKRLKKEYKSSPQKVENFAFQNNVALENLTIGYLIVSPLYTHKQPCLIGVREDCLQLQQLEFNDNLQKLSNGTPLATSFVLLDGAVCRLEAFDVLVAVAFDGFDIQQNSFLIKNLFLRAKQFYENNGFLQLLQQQIETQLVIKVVLHSLCFVNRSIKSKKASLASLATSKTPFFYKKGMSPNKEIMEDFSSLDELFKNPYDPQFSGIKVYKLSLCSVSQLAKSALKQNSKYIYKILTSEKSLATFYKNPRLAEIDDEEKLVESPYKKRFKKRQNFEQDSDTTPSKKTKN